MFRSKSQVVALADVDGVKKYSARLLYRANVKTVDDIVAASEEAIRAILVKGAPRPPPRARARTARNHHAT